MDLNKENNLRKLLDRTSPDERTGCLNWLGHIDKSGYGKVFHNNRTECVHRVMWEMLNGPIPAGNYVIQKCFNRSCSNPDHLCLSKTKRRMSSYKKPKHTYMPLISLKIPVFMHRYLKTIAKKRHCSLARVIRMGLFEFIRKDKMFK